MGFIPDGQGRPRSRLQDLSRHKSITAKHEAREVVEGPCMSKRGGTCDNHTEKMILRYMNVPMALHSSGPGLGIDPAWEILVTWNNVAIQLSTSGSPPPLFLQSDFCPG